MKQKYYIKIISFLVAASTVLVGFCYRLYRQNGDYKLLLQNSYSKSFSDFSAAVNDISLTLDKARYVTNPLQLTGISANLLKEAEISKTALSQLPQTSELTTINKFLSQVGNYAMSVSKSASNDGSIQSSDKANIVLLADAAQKIATVVSESRITYDNAEYFAAELDKKVDKMGISESLGESLSSLDTSLDGLPTLIYDGPFSESIYNKPAEVLKNKEVINEANALKRAAEICECEIQSLSPDTVMEGNIPAYVFKGKDISVAVSKSGGYGIFMVKSRTVKKSILTEEQAVNKAERYLQRQNFTGFTDTYYFIDEGILTANFAFVDGETICYTDLIKVGVALDNGEIVSFEATKYLKNHKERAFETVEFTSKQAMEVIDPSLSVSSSCLTLIPTDSGEEKRCYEFLCASEDGRQVLVYVNAATLKEEQILIMLQSNNGVLVK